MTRRPSEEDRRSYDYRLTEKGLALYPVLIAITDWGERWAPNPSGPRIELHDRQTGKPIEPMTVRSRDGRNLSPFDVVARPGRGAGGEIRELLDRTWSSRQHAEKKERN